MDKNKVIGIASDHAGFSLKEEVKKFLEGKGFECIDFGTNSEESVDYPDFIHPLAAKVNAGILERAVIICGSANGVSMVANKYENVRAAICWNYEITKLARMHNDANLIALPARFIDGQSALDFVEIFINQDFEGGRHLRRVNKIKRQ